MEKKINNQRNQNNQNSQKRSVNKNKIVIKDKKKFGIIILVLVVIIILIIALNGKVKIDDTTDLSKLDTKKYSKELVEKYNSSKEKFLEDYNLIQGGVGLYIINNATLDSDSFSNMYKEITDMFSSSNWSKIDVEKNTYWNGTWSIDENGILKFKFGSKELEPTWVNDSDILGKVILN